MARRQCRCCRSALDQCRAAGWDVTHPVPLGLLRAAAADGKLLYGTVTDDERTLLVAAIDDGSGAVLGQRQVADKRGQNTALQPLLSGLKPRMAFTLDALHTSKKTALLITGRRTATTS